MRYYQREPWAECAACHGNIWDKDCDRDDFGNAFCHKCIRYDEAVACAKCDKEIPLVAAYQCECQEGDDDAYLCGDCGCTEEGCEVRKVLNL